MAKFRLCFRSCVDGCDEQVEEREESMNNLRFCPETLGDVIIFT